MSDLQQFRQTLVALCAGAGSDLAIVVPTEAAAAQARRSFDRSGVPPLFAPLFVTRDGLYDELHRRLENPPRRLSAFERDALAQAAAAEAARTIGELPFQIRPGLVAEMLRFYDQLRRQSQQVKRFEELLVQALAGGDDIDRGAERLLRQTRFLAAAFRGYEARVVESLAVDEHGLRDRFLLDAGPQALRHIVVTVTDWIADPAGLFVADFDLLARMPGLQSLDVVATEGILGSGFHERIHNWWPALEEVHAASIVGPTPRVRPTLSVPPSDNHDRLWFTHRDREDELVAIANRLTAAGRATDWDRVAVVFKRPLPYLYLAGQTLGVAGVPYQAADRLPLAAEPAVSLVDLVLDSVETRFTRESIVALLRSPHLDFSSSEYGPVTRESVAALNRFMSKRRYLGGLEHLAALAESPHPEDVAPSLGASHVLAGELALLLESRSASQQIRLLVQFMERHVKRLTDGDPFVAREQQARGRLFTVLGQLADAHAAHHDPVWTSDDLASGVRRWIAEETFPVEGAGGVQLLDDHAAIYGEFDEMTIVGLIEHEWPEPTRRNIFYPPGLLKTLGWPSEKDRQSAADARFLDLVASASKVVELSTCTLDDEALVPRSIQLDEVPRARLSSVTRQSPLNDWFDATPNSWSSLRAARTPADSPAFHGFTGAAPPQAWSVSALETYVGCPFKFFAQHILKLEEEPDDEEVMDPRRQGQFVHEVFERFFAAWQAEGHRSITAANLDLARALFVQVVDVALQALPEGEAGLERTRLLGSPAAAGLGEAVFRMEAERPTAVVERRLEHALAGPFTIATSSGARTIELKGKADRIDLLADGTFRLIDYKLGWPPDRSRALQLPIYGLCAEDRLAGYRGRNWTLGEAVYLAFKGPKRVVPLFANPAAKTDVLEKAQQRLADTIDAIERGDFPPTPDDVYRCETCAFAAVCRKDYVGDV